LIKSHTKTTVKGQDKVDALRKAIGRHKTAYVEIGFHEDAGEYEDGTSVVQVALWNEFGTETSPERSFFRTAIDENAAKINEWRNEMIGNIIEKSWTVQKCLDTMGFRIQVLVQNKIKSNLPPPNAPSTLEAKARAGTGSNTLMNTKLMLRSVTYKSVLK
jgi:hypothetical protein